MREMAPDPPHDARTCAGCGTTLSEFSTTGLLGCARCYTTFAREIEAAVEALHGVPAPPEPNPWPTRGAVRAPMAPATDRDVH